MNTASPAAPEPGAANKQRALLPVRRREDWPREAPAGPPIRRICVLDTETTGLDADRHQIIEICAAIVAVNEEGRIAAVQCVGTGLNDPGRPLTKEITALTGLVDADLKDQFIDRDLLTRFIGGCDGAIAFNAAFDRPFVERLLPQLAPMPWGCAMRDVAWRGLGFERGPQNYLLMQAGGYNVASHRARDDVLSLIELLDHVCEDGTSVMAKVLEAMDAPAWRFEASNAAYGYRHDLKTQRYRWAPERSHQLWHKHVRATEFRDEYRWYKQTVGKRPVVVPLPSTERYRADSAWQPVRKKLQTPAWMR